ncbi:hypothetical protein AXG93_3791s1110 [Marchantia polymorpha subsp. ruderalis]|uniref:phosphoenolpyruvate carboxykinase (ATP) n=1 Tax=Marchantia polymorpha subsp. ruderalis TaxID=1480154 RepID=A0A176WQ52_MARPO|nr:hypothetical protein AXG93_3791s1110 [Marchantia polymorpha subsp. ruderalis]
MSSGMADLHISGLKGLKKLDTTMGRTSDVCADDSVPTVRAQNLEELHSLQKKSAPNTPRGAMTPRGAGTPRSEEERQRQQLQSISTSLASLTRESGPQVVRGEPGNASAASVTGFGSRYERGPKFQAVSDSALKFTHVLYNLSPAELYEQALKSEKGSYITSTGALATLSGAKTGRSPKDKRVVSEESSHNDLWWGKGSPNIEMDEETFLVNRERAVDYLNSLDKVFVNDQFLNWDPENRIKVRIISARAYHSLFMHNMCIRPTPEELEDFGTPDFTIYNAGKFPCNRYTHYMTSSTSVDVNLKRREMVILGTQYAGEMKKGLFSLMHYLMPKRGILSLHSGCNMGKAGDVALFFGLSGTGKTTLSTDHNRLLIGDDEHCWGDDGVSNIEGGCYAKCIGLSKEREPDIWDAIKFGTVVENVVFDEHSREIDYDDKSVTENTRAAYPIEFIPNAKIPCVGPHPKNLILLACDAFGVLPPVSRLTLAQTMYHFISGYGVGSRMKLAYTRSIIDAIHDGSLLEAEFSETPIFGLHVPKAVAGVPSEILQPENSWKDRAAYTETLKKLAGLFQKNFCNFADYEVGGDSNLTQQILQAGPLLD